MTVTNNIIANNVAGWDGAGISLLDALKVNIINNTIVSNDTHRLVRSAVQYAGRTAGELGRDRPAPRTVARSRCPQPAGLVSGTEQLEPDREPAGDRSLPGRPRRYQRTGRACKYSVPALYNDVIWQNRAFDIGVGSLGTGPVNQQNVVALYNAFTNTARRRASRRPMPRPQRSRRDHHRRYRRLHGGAATGISACAATPDLPTTPADY